MSADGPRRRPQSEVGTRFTSASKPTARTFSGYLARFRSMGSSGNATWRRILPSIAMTALLTGIVLSCAFTDVLDGHPLIYTLP
ncbi:hypothetical protein GGR33_003184 [Methylobacterium brachythecii]|uniref:Uncharacterized protein n=1 Tax=Methylobacterium brachythecii TaxID=1176177 RepID=A0A7W6AM67_9HYPH|nr:hypothetical protein [Methylobacterium brachythecii]